MPVRWPAPRRIAPSPMVTLPRPVNGVSFQPFRVLPSNIDCHWPAGVWAAAVSATANQAIRRMRMTFSIPQRRDVGHERAPRDFEICETVGVCGIETGEVVHDHRGDGQLEILHPLQDALGDLVASVVTVMRVLARVCERLVRGIGSERLVE